MKNNKGFTLVETIAVIIILGVVLSIAVPSITNVVKSTNKNRMISDAETFASKAKEMYESDTIGIDINNKSLKEITELRKSPFGKEYCTNDSTVTCIRIPEKDIPEKENKNVTCNVVLKDENGNQVKITNGKVDFSTGNGGCSNG